MCDTNRNSQQISTLQWNVLDGSRAILFLSFSMKNNDNKAAHIIVARGKKRRKQNQFLSALKILKNPKTFSIQIFLNGFIEHAMTL